MTRNSIATEMNVFGYATICGYRASESKDNVVRREEGALTMEIAMSEHTLPEWASCQHRSARTADRINSPRYDARVERVHHQRPDRAVHPADQRQPSQAFRCAHGATYAPDSVRHLERK